MGAVLVHIDCDGDVPHPSSMKALAAGRVIASSWGASLYAAIIVHNPDEGGPPDATTKVVATTPASKRRATTGIPTQTAHDLGAATASLQQRLGLGGADKLVVIVTDADVAPLWAVVGGAWQQALDHLRPRLVLFGVDAPSAADLGPRTGARIGARMLLRARPVGTDLVELRDRDGGYVRAADSGASVALIGSAPRIRPGEPNIDCILIVAPGGVDERIELVGSEPAQLAHTIGAVVALGDELANDAAVVASAKRLATLLDGHLIGGAAAARAGAIELGAVVDRNTPLAPELCIALGTANVDLAGAASVMRVGTASGKTIDGALVGPVGPHLADLVAALEDLS